MGWWQLLTHQTLQLLLLPALGCGHTAVSSGTCACFHATPLKTPWAGKVTDNAAWPWCFCRTHKATSLLVYIRFSQDDTPLHTDVAGTRLQSAHSWAACSAAFAGSFPGFPRSPVGSENGTVWFPWLRLETLHFSSSKWQQMIVAGILKRLEDFITQKNPNWQQLCDLNALQVEGNEKRFWRCWWFLCRTHKNAHLHVILGAFCLYLTVRDDRNCKKTVPSQHLDQQMPRKIHLNWSTVSRTPSGWLRNPRLQFLQLKKTSYYSNGYDDPKCISCLFRFCHILYILFIIMI